MAKNMQCPSKSGSKYVDTHNHVLLEITTTVSNGERSHGLMGDLNHALSVDTADMQNKAFTVSVSFQGTQSASKRKYLTATTKRKICHQRPLLSYNGSVQPRQTTKNHIISHFQANAQFDLVNTQLSWGTYMCILADPREYVENENFEPMEVDETDT